MKKILLGFLLALVIAVPSYSYAADSTQTLLDLWKVVSGYITPRNSVNGLKIPALGSAGSPCLTVSALGVVATTTCGGVATPGGSSGQLQYNSAGSLAGVATGTAGTYLTASSTSASGYEWKVVSGTGSVTSVDMTVPTGLTVAGNPITTAGTLALSLTSGYNIPLTASTTNWNGFWDVPSTRITAGNNLTWTGNSLASYFATSTIAGITNLNFTMSTGTATGIGLTISTSTNNILFTPTVSTNYNIPLSASTTEWSGFYNTPSTRMTAGNNLAWSGNTINGTMASSTIIAGGTATHSPSITFATTTDTNILLNIVCGASTCTFNPSWTGTLDDGRIASAATWNAKLGSYNVVSANGLISVSTTTALATLTASTSPTYTYVGTTNASTTNLSVATNSYLGTVLSGTWNGGIIPIAYGGTATSTTPAASALLVGNGTNFDYATLPSCSNPTTSKLLYNNSTRAFSCGTDVSGSGGGSTTTITTNLLVNGPNFTFATGSATGLNLNISGDDGTATLTFTPQLQTGYGIPLTASTTEWSNFYTTPSTRITDGTALTWAGNTLNVDDLFPTYAYGTSTYATITNYPTYTYASSTFPSFSYATNTFATILNYPSYSYATNTFATLLNTPSYSYSSSTYVNFSYASNTFATIANYPTYTYASNTFSSLAYASSSYVTLWNLKAGTGISISTSSGATIANVTQNTTCTGTDKISAYNSATGAFTCSADQTGGVGGDSAWTIGSGLIYNSTSTDSVLVGTSTPTSATFYLQGSGSKLPIVLASSTGSTLFSVEANGSTTIANLNSANCDVKSSGGQLYCGIDATGGGSLSGGLNGYVARWTASDTVSYGILIDSGTYAGVNATSSLYTFNLQGSSGVSPFNISSSSGASLLNLSQSGTLTLSGEGTAGLSIGSSTPYATLVVQGTSTQPTLDFLRVASSSSATVFRITSLGRTLVNTDESFSNNLNNYMLNVNGAIYSSWKTLSMEDPLLFGGKTADSALQGSSFTFDEDSQGASTANNNAAKGTDGVSDVEIWSGLTAAETAATASGDGAAMVYGLGGVYMGFGSASNTPIFEALINASSTNATGTIFMTGLSINTQGADWSIKPNSGYYFIASSTSGANWIAAAQENAGSFNGVDTGVASTTAFGTWQKMNIVISINDSTGSATADYYINNVLVASITPSNPARRSGLGPFASVGATSAGLAKNMRIAYLKMWAKIRP